MEKYTRLSFWNGACERAVKTAAQTFLAVVGTSTVLGDVNWTLTASSVGMAALLSVVMAIADPDRADTAVTTYTPRHGGGGDGMD